MKKEIENLCELYEEEYRSLNYRIETFGPLLLLYEGEELYKLRRRIKLYYDMACECKKIVALLKEGK